MGVKSVGIIAGQQLPTIISPTNYKTRFRLAMQRYFIVSPGLSTAAASLAGAQVKRDAQALAQQPQQAQTTGGEPISTGLTHTHS